MRGRIAGAGLLAALGWSAIAMPQLAGVTTAYALAVDQGALHPFSAEPASSKPPAPMHPARLLDCELGRITNFDASKAQKPSDFRFEGRHAFRLFLPAIPVRTTPPPSSTRPPEPVDPDTRILADPDGLSRGASDKPFYRVVDYWPERVEMTTPVADQASNLVILDRFDTQRNTVNLFMTVANDAVTYDQAHLYAGPCQVRTGDAAITASH